MPLALGDAVEEQFEPARQRLHSAALGVLHVPVGHGLHRASPLSLYVPAIEPGKGESRESEKETQREKANTHARICQAVHDTYIRLVYQTQAQTEAQVERVADRGYPGTRAHQTRMPYGTQEGGSLICYLHATILIDVPLLHPAGVLAGDSHDEPAGHTVHTVALRWLAYVPARHSKGV